jgi:hypothetical protein
MEEIFEPLKTLIFWAMKKGRSIMFGWPKRRRKS